MDTVVCMFYITLNNMKIDVTEKRELMLFGSDQCGRRFEL